MKKFLAMIVVLTGLTAYSQTPVGGDIIESQIHRGLLDSRNRPLITLQTEKANEIRRGHVSYDGILVQFIKSDNKLQLLNPAAPAQYGSGRDNVVADAMSPARGSSAREGLKIFSIRF